MGTIYSEVKQMTIRHKSKVLECACPVLRTLAIAINDSEIEQSLIPALLDSKISVNVTAKRAQLAADYACSCSCPDSQKPVISLRV
jgi:hypothetical protein